MSGLMDVAQAASNAVASNVYGPVDLLAAALRKAGVPVPEDPFLGSEWLRKRGLIRDVPQGVEQVAGETLGLLAPAMLASKASQIASGMLRARENAAAPNVVNAGMRGGQRGIFIGPGAATWDAEAAAKAAQMEKAVAPARQIWQDTGTFRSADGKWRQEISDEAAKITDAVFDGIKAAQRFDGPMADALTHSALYRAYPDTGKIGSGFYAWRTPEGSYQAASNTITAGGPGTTSQKSTALHELQHAIQQREGFAAGGVPEIMSQIVRDAKARELAPVAGGRSAYEGVSNKLGNLYQAQYLKKLEAISSKASPKPSEITNMSAWYEYSDKLRAELGAMPKQAGSARDAWIRDAANFMRNQEARKIYGIEWKPEFRLSADELNKQVASLKRQADKFTAAAQEAARVEGKFKKLEGLPDYDLYRRLAGEAEARATQSRMNMTPAERRAMFPFDSYDVPVDQLIVR